MSPRSAKKTHRRAMKEEVSPPLVLRGNKLMCGDKEILTANPSGGYAMTDNSIAYAPQAETLLSLLSDPVRRMREKVIVLTNEVHSLAVTLGARAEENLSTAPTASKQPTDLLGEIQELESLVDSLRHVFDRLR